MNYNIFFSPTGGTRKVVQYMGEKESAAENLDLSMEVEECHMTQEDFCIVGVPSFGGRVPERAVYRLRRFRGEQTPVLLVVTYGNRAYEDTLKELKDVMEAQGFVCIGAAAIVTPHSIMHEFGVGRPTREEYQEIDTFMEKITKRLQGRLQSVEVPGNTPYKELHVAAMQPQASENCVRCGLCAGKCPAGAIPSENPQMTDNEKCISCMRCVSICPVQARKCDPAKVKMLTERLRAACSEPKRNEFF